MENKTITVETTVNAPVEKVWELWNAPKHIVHWAFASDDWEAPSAENDLRVGGKFKTVMAAKDGSTKFDFGGIYTDVVPNELIQYTIGDGREVIVKFQGMDGKTNIVETFEVESTNTEELQRNGWQSILNNFKKYAESR